MPIRGQFVILRLTLEAAYTYTKFDDFRSSRDMITVYDCGLQNLQEARLSQRDCVMHYVSWNLVNFWTAVWKTTFVKAAIGEWPWRSVLLCICQHTKSQVPSFTNSTDIVQDWRSTLHKWCFYQLQSHMTEKLSQISKNPVRSNLDIVP